VHKTGYASDIVFGSHYVVERLPSNVGCKEERPFFSVLKNTQ